MALNLRKYENQAVFSVAMAVVGAVCALASALIVLKRFNWEHFTLTYNRSGKLVIIFAASMLLAMGASAIGFGMGFNSAGQKRNTKSRLSWLGFFLSAGAIALALIVAIFFAITRDPITIH